MAAAAVGTSEGASLAAGSPGRPEEDGTTTVEVTEAVSAPEGTTSVVVPDAGGGAACPEDTAGPEGAAPEVGTDSPGLTTLVGTTSGGALLMSDTVPDSPGGGAYKLELGEVGSPGLGTHSVTVTVTVAAGAQSACRYVSLCFHRVLEAIELPSMLNGLGTHSQSRRQPAQARLRLRRSCSRTC